MALHCGQCGYPMTGRDAACSKCANALMSEEEAAAARERWDRLPEPAKQEFDAAYERRRSDWERSHQFFERKMPVKCMVAGAIVFGVAGVPCGAMALAYALAGGLAGRILSRKKGGIFLGMIAGGCVFLAVYGFRLLIAILLPVDALTFLFHAASTLYADRIVAIVCPVGGALLGHLIENEFEWW